MQAPLKRLSESEVDPQKIKFLHQSVKNAPFGAFLAETKTRVLPEPQNGSRSNPLKSRPWP